MFGIQIITELKFVFYLFQEMMRQGILNWQSKQFEQRRQMGSGQDPMLQLQVSIQQILFDLYKKIVG